MRDRPRWRLRSARLLSLFATVLVVNACSLVDPNDAGFGNGQSPERAAAPAVGTHALSAVVVGDSLSVQARDAIQQRLPGAVIDAEVGRTMVEPNMTDEALPRIPELAVLDAAWFVVELGTNDSTFAGRGAKQLSDDMDTLLDAIGVDRCIAWVLPFATEPRSALEIANTNTFREIARAKVEQLTCGRVLDWGEVATAEPPVLASDGVHLSDLGEARLADLIAFGVG